MRVELRAAAWLVLAAVVLAVGVFVYTGSTAVDDPLFLLWVALAAVAVFAAVAWKRGRDWRRLGETLGLAADVEPSAFHLGGPSALRGHFQGRSVSLWTYTRGSGKNKTTWTAASATAPRANPYFQVHGDPEGLFDRVAKAFGGQDVRVDDEAFDKAFRIRSDDEASTRRALDPMTREVLLTLARKREWEIQGAVATIHARGLVTNVRDATALLEAACRLAHGAENVRAVDASRA